DVSSNALVVMPGRYYVIALDDYHTSIGRQQTLKDAARRFVTTTLGPSDMAAVVSAGGRTSSSHPFTNNQERLLKAIDQFAAQKGSGSIDAVIDPFTLPERYGQARRDKPEVDEQGRLAASLLISLRGWVNALSGLPGRTKTIVLFTEGTSYPLDPFG